MQAKELLIKDKSTIVSFLKQDVDEDLTKLMNSMKILNEEPLKHKKQTSSKDPLSDSNLDADQVMLSFLNLCLKTKIDPQALNPIQEDPYENQSFPDQEPFEEPNNYEPIQQTFNIDAFVEEDEEVFQKH